MTKRKAEISLDEWLGKGVLSAEASKAIPTASTTEGVTESTTGAVRSPLNEEAVAVPTAMVDVAERDAAEWFWELLAQSGYEWW